MTGNPKLFLSRTGYREVDAATASSASMLNPGAEINGVLFTGATNILLNLTGPITSIGNATSISNSINLPGSPTTSTQAPLTDNTTIATTAYVDAAVAAAPFAFTWNQVTGPTNMINNNGYVANNSSRVILTLPMTSIFGDIIRVAGKGAGGWQISQNAGQTIHFGDDNTTAGVGGSVSSQNSNDTIELLCTTDNTDFTVLSSIGNQTIT